MAQIHEHRPMVLVSGAPVSGVCFPSDSEGRNAEGCCAHTHSGNWGLGLGTGAPSPTAGGARILRNADARQVEMLGAVQSEERVRAPSESELTLTTN
jgi:hypothetical protein